MDYIGRASRAAEEKIAAFDACNDGCPFAAKPVGLEKQKRPGKVAGWLPLPESAACSSRPERAP
jgi:hypothetical protein